MGLLNIFKKTRSAFVKDLEGKKESKKKAKRAPKPKKKEEAKEMFLEAADLTKKTKRAGKKDFSDAYRVLRGPHITEKATDLGKEDKYIFKVFPGANKTEIKKAVRDLYGVGVAGVNIINIHSKTKRVAGRRRTGRKAGYKKAIVALYPGEKIELLPR